MSDENETEPADKSDDDVQWQTDTLLEASTDVIHPYLILGLFDARRRCFTNWGVQLGVVTGHSSNQSAWLGNFCLSVQNMRRHHLWVLVWFLTCTIIEAPEHHDFIKNMITGTSQADCAYHWFYHLWFWNWFFQLMVQTQCRLLRKHFVSQGLPEGGIGPLWRDLITAGARATGSVTVDLFMKSMKSASKDDTELSTKYEQQGGLWRSLDYFFWYYAWTTY